MDSQQTIRIAVCTCQKLKIECSGEPASVSLCSCLDCQRRTGSAFGVAAFFLRANVKATGKKSRYNRTNEDGFDFSFYFCPDCGGTVFWETTRKEGFVAVAAGSFADPDFPPPTQAVYEEHKHPWVHFSL